ncbi:MAG: GDSL-type esterase/lipase family protein [Rikenellaceae bacterium]|jgi:lysophospholipase L1-like esterase|nr:GDSL-type esterase/lipase family protein [Rikenellaceae bacterium]
MKKIGLITVIAMFATALSAQEKGDWANYGRYAEANAALTKAPDVVFMGNSIVQVWADNRPAVFADNNYAGRGISGQVTAQMLARFQSDVVALSPKEVVILAGINDIAENNGSVPIPEIAHNIISMCQIARVNGIEPIIISVLPASEFRWRPEIKDVAESVKSLNGLLKEWATANDCAYVDMWSEMANEKGGLSPDLASDGVHPTSAGYEMMESMILPHL